MFVGAEAGAGRHVDQVAAAVVVLGPADLLLRPHSPFISSVTSVVNGGSSCGWTMCARARGAPAGLEHVRMVVVRLAESIREREVVVHKLPEIGLLRTLARERREDADVHHRLVERLAPRHPAIQSQEPEPGWCSASKRSPLRPRPWSARSAFDADQQGARDATASVRT